MNVFGVFKETVRGGTRIEIVVSGSYEHMGVQMRKNFTKDLACFGKREAGIEQITRKQKKLDTCAVAGGGEVDECITHFASAL